MRKLCDTSRGVLGTIAHTVPVAGAVDCGRKQRTLQSGLMKLSMVLSAVTEKKKKWVAALLFKGSTLKASRGSF